MTELEAIAQTLAELGPQLEDIEQIEQLTEDVWLVVFDEETAIEITADPVGHKLCFSMLLATIEESRRAELLPTLLTYSYLKQETGGFHFGMDGVDGNVHLMLDLGHLELTPDELAGVLVGMLETGETWRETLTAERLSDEEIEDDSVPTDAAGESASGIPV